MIQILKKRVAIFLSILFVLPAIICILPMSATEVLAASSVTLYFDYGSGSASNPAKMIEVEKGQKFYIGDYVRVDIYNNSSPNGIRYTASMINASYSSSKTAVASVQKTGYLTAKKIGTTNITVKYKGKKLIIPLKVVKSKSLSNKSAVTKLKKAANTLSKNVGSTITTQNGYEAIATMAAYKKVASKTGVSASINNIGFLKKKVKSSYGYTYTTTTTQLAVPQAGRSLTLGYLLDHYVNKNNPTSTRSAKCLRVSGVTATTENITLSLQNSVSASQILAQNIIQGSSSGINKTGAEVYVYIQDITEQKSYEGTVLLKQGSRMAEIILKDVSYNNATQKYETIIVNPKIGHTYQIGETDGWTEGKKVTVR